jgi:hypothetical protein
MEFLAKKNGKEYGPYSFEEIYELVKTGEFKETDLTWNSITKQWQTVGEAIPMEKQVILVHKGGQQYGPYTLLELYSRIEAGDYNRDTDLAWRDGMTEWVSLGEILETREIRPFEPIDQQTIQSDDKGNIITVQNEIIKKGKDISLVIGTVLAVTLSSVAKDLANDLEKPDVTSTRDLIGERIDLLYTKFFGIADAVESNGVEVISRQIIDNTLRSDVKNRTANSIGRELKQDALEDFILSKNALRQVIDQLGLQYQSISVTDGALSSAMTGVALNYLVTGGKSGSTGAVVGAVMGAGARLAEQGGIRQQLYVQGLESCASLLEALPKATIALFEQFVISCLNNRPENNDEYHKAILILRNQYDETVVPMGKNLISLIAMTRDQAEAAFKLKAAKKGSGCITFFMLSFLAVLLLLGIYSYSCEAFAFCWILAVFGVITIFSFIPALKKQSERRISLQQVVSTSADTLQLLSKSADLLVRKLELVQASD